MTKPKKTTAAPIERPRAGGSYVRDRKTGALTQVAGTATDVEQPSEAPADEQSSNSQPATESGQTEA